MVGSMASFSLEDLFLKWAAGVMPAGQIIAMLGLAGALFFSVLVWRNGQSVFTRQALSRPVMLRNITEAAGSMLYIPALALLPLSVNSAILQAAPLVVTLGASFFLGEMVGWRRWTAISVGLIGVLTILQPGTDGFRLAGLLTVGCVVLLAARDLSTRVIPRETSTVQLTAWAYIALVPAGLLLMLFERELPINPLPMEWAGLGVALICGIVGYYAVTLATRMGEASVVAPFRYTRLVFALVLSAIFLGERPDIWMAFGSVLVVGSGLYTFAREARLRARPSPLAGQPL